jgi:hypothetical protein
MSTPPATARFLLFPQQDSDNSSEVKAVKVRRYRLARLEINPLKKGRPVALDYLKRTHD